MTTIEVVRTIHIAGGAAALASLWIPLIAPKGARLHRRAGWVFVGGMGIVSLTAVALAAYRFFVLPGAGSSVAAVFLAYLGVLTGAGTYKGIRVLRTKDRTGRTRSGLDIAVAGATLLFGPPTAAVGLMNGFAPVILFGVIGTIGGFSDLRYWLRAPQERMHWWYQHMGDMIGTSIAAITAFLVLNSRNLGIGQWSVVLWVGPTAVGLPLLAWWLRYYRRRFSGTAAVAHDHAPVLDHVGDGGHAGAQQVQEAR